MAVSQKAIAKHLGVSQALVGMALNGHPRISASTRERVEQAARELDYNPDLNHGARQLAARRHGLKIPSNAIAVCALPSTVPLHRQPFEGDILDGIESVCDKYGLDMLQCRLRAERLPRLIEKGEVDGIITLSSQAEHHDLIRQLNLPLVNLGGSNPYCHSLGARHYEGMSLATNHLIELGHRHIAFIGHDVTVGQEESILLQAAIQRHAAYRDTMQKAGLPAESIDCTLRDGYPEEGAEAFNKLWHKMPNRITAVVCYNDAMAMGVVQAAQRLGLNVPRDLSVIGFDAVTAQFAFEPVITSVGYDRRAMGERAVEILMQVREAGAAVMTAEATTQEFIHEELPVHFVAGATTAPPPTFPA